MSVSSHLKLRVWKTNSQSDYEIYFTSFNHLVLFKPFRNSPKMIQTSAIQILFYFQTVCELSISVSTCRYLTTSRQRETFHLAQHFGYLTHCRHLSLADIAGHWCCHVSGISAALLALSKLYSLPLQEDMCRDFLPAAHCLTKIFLWNVKRNFHEFSSSFCLYGIPASGGLCWDQPFVEAISGSVHAVVAELLKAWLAWTFLGNQGSLANLY